MVDAATFKNVLSRWATGVTIVTSRCEGTVHGMTASSFCSVSLRPPLILVCVNRAARTHAAIAEQQAFGVHILRRGMEEICDRCAGFVGEEAHLLSDLNWRTEVTGAPILDDTLAWVDCSLWNTYDGGDHTIYVGQVQAAGVGEGEPLLWFERGYYLSSP
jgi:flavin reductase (DIM6/NTAB) family NADH-FMN oxidoreductase RutF